MGNLISSKAKSAIIFLWKIWILLLADWMQSAPILSPNLNVVDTTVVVTIIIFLIGFAVNSVLIVRPILTLLYPLYIQNSWVEIWQIDQGIPRTHSRGQFGRFHHGWALYHQWQLGWIRSHMVRTVWRVYEHFQGRQVKLNCFVVLLSLLCLALERWTGYFHQSPENHRLSIIVYLSSIKPGRSLCDHVFR